MARLPATGRRRLGSGHCNSSPVRGGGPPRRGGGGGAPQAKGLRFAAHPLRLACGCHFPVRGRNYNVSDWPVGERPDRSRVAGIADARAESVVDQFDPFVQTSERLLLADVAGCML